MAAAAAIGRYHEGRDVRPHFAGNPRINETILGLEIEAPFEDQELWITDISWTSKDADRKLRELAERGLPIYWIDHHRTAIERLATGEIDVPFAHRIVDDRVSAALLVYEYLARRLAAAGERRPSFESFEQVALLADDNDRWIHAMDGSWKLALTLRALDGAEAFDELSTLDERVEYTPVLEAAWNRVDGEMRRSFELAVRTRTTRDLDGVQVVSAVCDGYPSEIADRWGKETQGAVFALFDLKGGGVSYRRSPDCPVDLSQVAKVFGGGGHPAAAGSEIPELLTSLARETAEKVAGAVKLVSSK